MSYTKHLVAITILSTVSLSSLVSAATGSGTVTTAVTTSTTTTSLDVKSAPRLVKKAADSVTLEWDKVASASAYIVKYSKSSVATSKDPNAQYDNETDSLTTTGTTITKLSTSNEKLSPSTPYYFSVVAIDSTGKESDTYSDELMVMTDATNTTTGTGMVAASSNTALAIKDIGVSDDKTLSLSFNMPLASDSVQVKITKTSDNSDVVVGTVVNDATNPNSVTVTTISPLSASSSYTLTVLTAKDTMGNNIQEGVSGIKEFTTTEALKLTTPALTAAPEMSAS